LKIDSMKLLAFDTSTETLSIAVQHGGQVWTHTGAGGAQASATLIPAIQALLAQAGLTLADLDALVFGRGPGSFTGLRTACSVAQGLAYGTVRAEGTPLPVLPVDTLLAVAEDARLTRVARGAAWTPEASGGFDFTALLDARMDQVYAARYRHGPAGWLELDAPQLLAPEAVVAHGVLAGNAFAAYGPRLPANAPRIDALPTAAALLRLAPALMAGGHTVGATGAMPLYIRDKVAKTTAERAHERASPLPSPAP
jgi:tRNA threonylcarbamoyladenosine biosynthesis protein TsaB